MLAAGYEPQHRHRRNAVSMRGRHGYHVNARRDRADHRTAGSACTKARRTVGRFASATYELINYNLAGAHGPLPCNLDTETVALIKRVQAVGIGMKTVPHGDARPIRIPSRVAYEIIRAVRGDRVEPR